MGPGAVRFMKYVAIIGTGFVADLYMSSLQTFPDIALRGVTDRDPDRLAAFAAHWNVPAADSIPALLETCAPGDLILNLTNPGSHYAVSRECLEAGHHVYSEKPLAMSLGDARALHDLARDKGLMLASAPCSFLSETAQTLWAALRAGEIGTPLAVYAELDDGFISQAPYQGWISASGAPWPARDEFEVGCTLEHAGYYLTWLMMCFGPVRHVVAGAAELDKDKLDGAPTAPDFSVGILYFDNGVVARLTCSIIAAHDHALRVFGTESGDVRLEVVDTGIGIPEAEQDRVFAEFGQAMAAGSGGSGLGLAIAKRLVELHGGELELESIVDEGSRFIVTLPGWKGDA